MIHRLLIKKEGQWAVNSESTLSPMDDILIILLNETRMMPSWVSLVNVLNLMF